MSDATVSGGKGASIATKSSVAKPSAAQWSGDSKTTAAVGSQGGGAFIIGKPGKNWFWLGGWFEVKNPEEKTKSISGYSLKASQLSNRQEVSNK
jgi:hypothetical protein